MNDRLETMREYLKEAKKDPEANRLYIDDLKLAIADAERFEPRKEIKPEKGFVFT